MGHRDMRSGPWPREAGRRRGGFAAEFGPEPGDRRQRGHGGPPPWVAEMFGSRSRGFGAGFGPGFGGPGGGRRGRGGPRVRRGDVRAAILDVLATAGAPEGQGDGLNGYQVIQHIGEKTDGVWKPSPGSVYPTIQQLEDEGLVATDESGGRKVLRLTEAGRAYVAEHPDEMAAVWAPFAEAEGEQVGDLHDLKKVIGQTMAAVWQLASTGTTAQMQEAAQVLAETRRKLYTILAEGDDALGEGSDPA
ncbi:MAG: transcriptional regulator, PadR family [Nocardioidaceae bacterium]|nr:transcriptional regulator, PadR family [Nocardioidaceae bacterium]